MREKISVIMSSYKENENCLREAIESVLEQTYQNLEFIILLDNPDNELHKKIIGEYEARDSRIQFYINEKNIGLTATLNRALQLVEGEYVARMDADDVCVPQRLEWQLEELKRRNLDLVGSYLKGIDEKGKEIFVYDNLPLECDTIRRKILLNNCVPHSSWLVKRNVYNRLDGYREIPLCEDYDFLLRASQKGFRIGNLARVAMFYRMTEQSLSRNSLLKQYLISRYLVKCYKKGCEYDEQQAELILQKKCTEKNNFCYNQSNAAFNQGLLELNRGKKGRALVYLIRAFVGSRFFAGKMLAFVRAAL